ncbi:MAG: AAA family ATPase [Lachnospiraceae bacterium]|nr:AAA family ATPase [Lachnospiraceae bacterium]
MAIERLELENFTVYESLEASFDSGINVLIGENGSGKTHVMKILHSACQATDPGMSFTYKLVRTMLPDDYKVSRLIRRRQGNQVTKVKVIASEAGKKKTISTEFNIKTKKWEAPVKGEDTWERDLKSLSSIFIPAKEILSNSYNLGAAVDKNNVRFDDTYIDIINSAKIDISVGRNTAEKERQLNRIESITEGKTYYDPKEDEFYLKIGNSKQEFNLVAEGIRKMALLWQLIKNGALEKGTVLFWDEPEANINPLHIPVIAELLLELQRNGVQVFVATHDYMLAKYFEVKKKEGDSVRFHSFYKEDNQVKYEFGDRFGSLKHNTITEAFNKLLDEIYDMGE